MQFKKIDLCDIEILKKYYYSISPTLCDYTVGCTLMWKDSYNMEYAIENGTFYTSETLPHENTTRYYMLPISKNIKLSVKYAVDRNDEDTTYFTAIPEPYKDCFILDGYTTEFVEDRDFADYVYRADELVSLSGKKYAGQRNHIHHFEQNVQNWSLEEINDTNREEIIAFLKNDFDPGADCSEDFKYELSLAEQVVNAPEKYNMTGKALRADGAIVGFSLSEVVGNMLFTHIEKANRNFPGAYQMLVNQYTKSCLSPAIEYVNREDDEGDAGLRTAKQAYHPAYMANKYTVIIRRNH